jgi:hypothetical protein
MKNFQAIASGIFLFLVLNLAQAQGKQEWTDHKCNKDPFTNQVSCSMVVLETLPEKGVNVPGALFAWVISKGEKNVLLMLSLSTLEEPKIVREKGSEKALDPILVRVDSGQIHTIKPTEIVLSAKQAPPFRQIFEIGDELLTQLAIGEKVFLRFESHSGERITKEFALKGMAEKLYAMMAKYMELRHNESK